jgi:hypothetical protein
MVPISCGVWLLPVSPVTRGFSWRPSERAYASPQIELDPGGDVSSGWSSCAGPEDIDGACRLVGGPDRYRHQPQGWDAFSGDHLQGRGPSRSGPDQHLHLAQEVVVVFAPEFLGRRLFPRPNPVQHHVHARLVAKRQPLHRPFTTPVGFSPPARSATSTATRSARRIPSSSPTPTGWWSSEPATTPPSPSSTRVRASRSPNC